MNERITKEIVDKIFANVFNCENPFTVQEIFEKFAYDLNLPKEVKDSVTGESTWAISINPTKFISQKNSFKIESWMQEKVELTGLEDILKIWDKINYTTTERCFDSVNTIESDTVYQSENMIRSSNSFGSKNVVFTDGSYGNEYVLASRSAKNCQYSIKIDESSNCTNSYHVTNSDNISNSMFIRDCTSLHECIFCSYISNKKFCIANMQFEEEEYYAMKKEIIKWIINKG